MNNDKCFMGIRFVFLRVGQEKIQGSRSFVRVYEEVILGSMGNRRIKRILFTIGIFLLLGTLARFQVPPVQAINNFYTTVQSGQATDSSGSIFANYGSSSQYAYNKPDSATIIAFYRGLSSHLAHQYQKTVFPLPRRSSR